MNSFELRSEDIKYSEYPSWGANHLPLTDFAELYQTAQEQTAEPSISFMTRVVGEQAVNDEDNLLSLTESIDSINEQRITHKRTFTLEGLEP